MPKPNSPERLFLELVTVEKEKHQPMLDALKAPNPGIVDDRSGGERVLLWEQEKRKAIRDRMFEDIQPETLARHKIDALAQMKDSLTTQEFTSMLFHYSNLYLLTISRGELNPADTNATANFWTANASAALDVLATKIAEEEATQLQSACNEISQEINSADDKDALIQVLDKGIRHYEHLQHLAPQFREFMTALRTCRLELLSVFGDASVPESSADMATNAALTQLTDTLNRLSGQGEHKEVLVAANLSRAESLKQSFINDKKFAAYVQEYFCKFGPALCVAVAEKFQEDNLYLGGFLDLDEEEKTSRYQAAVAACQKNHPGEIDGYLQRVHEKFEEQVQEQTDQLVKARSAEKKTLEPVMRELELQIDAARRDELKSGNRFAAFSPYLSDLQPEEAVKAKYVTSQEFQEVQKVMLLRNHNTQTNLVVILRVDGTVKIKIPPKAFDSSKQPGKSTALKAISEEDAQNIRYALDFCNAYLKKPLEAIAIYGTASRQVEAAQEIAQARNIEVRDPEGGKVPHRPSADLLRHQQEQAGRKAQTEAEKVAEEIAKQGGGGPHP